MPINIDQPYPAPPPPMSDEEIEARAAADTENPPWTDTELAAAKRVPRVRTLRHTLHLTQEEFSKRYMIPVQTLRAWEQGITEPDAAGRAYIRAIIGAPEAVAQALHANSRTAAE